MNDERLKKAEYEESLVETKQADHSHTTMITVQKKYKEGAVIVGEKQSEHTVEVQMPPIGVPLAKVGAEARMTINMGNFESVQLGVSVELPCVVEEVSDCYKAARALVDLQVNKEVSDIRAYRDTKKTGE